MDLFVRLSRYNNVSLEFPLKFMAYNCIAIYFNTVKPMT